jgi:hypothetical protein
VKLHATAAGAIYVDYKTSNNRRAAKFSSFILHPSSMLYGHPTWNHPVLVGDVVLVRTDHKMPASRLPIAQ